MTYKDIVRSISYSYTGAKLVSLSDGNVARLWNTETGEVLLRLKDVTAAAISRDGSVMALGLPSQALRIYDTSTGSIKEQLSGAFEHPSFANPIQFSPDGRYLGACSLDSDLLLWEHRLPASRGPKAARISLGSNGKARVYAFSPDNRTIAIAATDSGIYICTLDDHCLQSTLKGHSGCINSVAFSPDGSHLVSGGQDRSIRVWNLATNTSQRLYQAHSVIYSTAFSREHVAVGFMNGHVHLHDIHTGQLAMPSLEGHSSRVTSLEFSADGTRLMSGAKSLCVWDIELAVRGGNNSMFCSQIEIVLHVYKLICVQLHTAISITFTFPAPRRAGFAVRTKS